MTEWYVDGGRQGSVAIADRALQYGDGLFETVAIRNDEARLWPLHIDRLAQGCERLNIAMPAAAELLQQLQLAVRDSGLETRAAVVKIIVSAGGAERGYGRARVDSPGVYIGVFPPTPLPRRSYREGIEVILCKTRLATGSATSGLKTLNRLEQVLARSEASAAGVDEGLTQDVASQIVCGTMSNLFYVADGEVCTPPLQQCGVAGVMRRYIIELMNSHTKPINIRAISASKLDTVDEMFLSNSQFGVVPVTRCERWQRPVGAATRRVMQVLADNGIDECRL